MKYTASSLEDIAKQFDSMGLQCSEAAKRHRNARDVNINLGAMSAWRDASDFLRNTTLTGEA